MNSSNPRWESAADEILADPGLTVILGPGDSGKTTFLRFLAARAAAVFPLTAIVDADIGQSSAGPPGAVGLAYFERGTSILPPPWPAAALYYVGSVAPAGHLLPLVIGTARLVERARAAGAAPILVDTTGLVQGGIGRALKEAKLDAVRPRHLAVIGSHPDLEAAIAPRAADPGTRLHRLEPSPLRRARPPGERAENRRRAFAAYFAAARQIVLDPRRLICARRPGPPRPGEIIGLAGPAGDTLALAEVLAATPAAITLRAPLPAGAESSIRCLQLGELRVDPGVADA